MTKKRGINPILKVNHDSEKLLEPKIIHVHLITDDMIEIKFNKDVISASEYQNYSITADGEELEYEIAPYAFKTVTFKIKNSENIKDKKLELEILRENIIDREDRPVEKNRFTVLRKDYFSQKYVTKTGINIYAIDDVKYENLVKAGKMVDIMLNKRNDIAEEITNHKGGLSILAYNEHAYMQPDLRFYYDRNYLYVEGFGGEIAQCTEYNLERIKDITAYPNESILVHEFAHTIHITGIKNRDIELYKRIEDTFEKVRKEGKWENTYSGSNPHEYFAVGTTIWFNVMSESKDGSFDGTRGPVNTRKELKEYDIDLYDILSDFYEKNLYFEEPWNNGSCPDLFDINGNKNKQKG